MAERVDLQGDESVTICVTEDGVILRDAGSESPNLPPTKVRRVARNNRFSLVNRRPIQSSPLAGPVLSNSSEVEADADIDEELPSIHLPLSSPSLAKPSRKKAKKGPVRFFIPPRLEHPHIQSLDASSLPPRRSSLDATLKYPSFGSSTAALPEIPLWDLPRLPYTPPPRRPGSVHGLPQPFPSTNTPRPIANRVPQHSDFSPPPPYPYINTRHPSTSPDPSKNWMTTNTYETTPRFSRLGISAPTIILPIAASDYKRATTRNMANTAPVQAPPPAPGVPRPAMPPSEDGFVLALTRLSSANSSRETLCGSPSSSISSSARSSYDLGTVVEDGEEEEVRPSCASIGISGEVTVKKGFPLIAISPKAVHGDDASYRIPSLSSLCESATEPRIIAPPELETTRGSVWLSRVKLGAQTLPTAFVKGALSHSRSDGKRRGAEATGTVTRSWRKLSDSGRRLGRKSDL